MLLEFANKVSIYKSSFFKMPIFSFKAKKSFFFHHNEHAKPLDFLPSKRSIIVIMNLKFKI